MNGKAISEELFVKYFWQTWDLLQASRSTKWPNMPGWFRYLTLLAFKVFQEEKVDCAVVEVGLGGRADSTNILTAPAACGVTLLDYDHVDVLGNTLALIASEKAGIFKQKVPAITVAQTQEALDTLRQHASAMPCPLFLSTSTLESFAALTANIDDSTLGLSANFLKQNAVLAIGLSELWLTKWNPSHVKGTASRNILSGNGALRSTSSELLVYEPHELHAATIQGIRNFKWPGRAQIYQLPTDAIKLFLDGAHTPESVKACVEWFGAHTAPSATTSHALIFNCNKPRDPSVLLLPIVNAIASGRISVDLVYFTMSQVAPQYRRDHSNDIAYNANPQITWQQEIAGKWAELVIKAGQASSSETTTTEDWEESLAKGESSLPTEGKPTTVNGRVVVWPQVKIVEHVDDCIKEIKDWVDAEELGPKKVDVLVTGSLYLVGAMLEYLNFPTDL